LLESFDNNPELNSEGGVSVPSCLFCRILNKEIPAKIVFEDSVCLAFEDINPKAPTHILVIPKKHIDSLDTLLEEDESALGHLFLVARNLAKARGIHQSGYRTVLNTGTDAGQSVFHIHLHLLGGRRLAWPPG
jgi:histidine triad (HIT) family protein